MTAQKPDCIVVQAANPAAFAGRGSMIAVEFSGKDIALKAARTIASETRRVVTVWDEEGHVLLGAVNGY